MDDCVFCKIVRGELPSVNVYEDSKVIAFESIKPAAEVHILICPKKHIESFVDIEKNFDFMKMVSVAQRIIKDKKTSWGYKLIFNGGKYQFIPHLHWHLLGGKFEESWVDRI